MSQKAIKITGWALTVILGLLFTMSALMKLTKNDEVMAQAISIGFDPLTYQIIGVIEIISLILFVIPRTGVFGTLLLAAYMGGAIVTHLQHQEPIMVAVVIQSLIWITAFLRFPELNQRLISPKTPKDYDTQTHFNGNTKQLA